MKAESYPRPCRIVQVGLARNGYPKWWCPVHGGNATGRKGIKLEVCDAADADGDLKGCLDLDPTSYPGGVGLWAALEPVLDTTGRPSDEGIHVHARRKAGRNKYIDKTYPSVALRCQSDLFGHRPVVITRSAARSYYFSKFAEARIKNLSCPRCGAVHLDTGAFAIRPHRKHLCQGCGRHFHDHEEAVSNPVMLAREALGDTDAGRQLIRPERTLDVRLSDYPGGVQVWASNPAIFWTAPRPEEEGIHVHLFEGCRGAPVVDDTYACVRLNGVLLNEQMVQHLMAQQALGHLSERVEALQCPACGEQHFDQGILAFNPHSDHTCEACSAEFRSPGRHRLVVSNPLVSVVKRLQATEAHQAVEATR